MDSMKKVLFLMLALTLIAFCFTGCDTMLSSFGIPLSDGVFEYTLNGDKSSYTVIGLKEDKAEDIVIPETFKDMPVTAIGNAAFEKSSITGVSIPSSIKRIGANAFVICKDLCNVTFYGTDIEFDVFAFSHTGIKRISLPEGVTKLEKYMFSNCESLTEVKLPDSLTVIEESAFLECKSLESIDIPSGVEKIGYGAFQRTALKNVIIPGSVTELAPTAFSFCEDLSDITVDVKNALYKSEDGIVYSKNGESLLLYPQGKSEEFFSVPQGVTQIGDFAFYYAENLNNVVLCDGITVIGRDAFSSCSIRDVILPDSVVSVSGRAFASCAFMEKAVIGNGVTEIGEEVFESCFRLKKVVVGESVKSIGERAFAHCNSLLSVVLPSGIETIGINAFGNCKSMKSVFFNGNAEEWKSMPVSPECGDGLVGVDVYCFTESQPVTEGNFWHYNTSGEPIVW